MEFLVVWIICGVVAAMIASAKGSSGCGFAIVGFFLGPLGIIIALVASGVECPYCKKKIHEDATICPHCQKELNLNKLGLVDLVEFIISGKECPCCKKKVHKNTLICPHCQKKLNPNRWKL